ncbi:MAG: hypothetical protein UY85_C0010G0010 [Candidatus Peribacteria bacterium GW2011_GWB1_54_5]|nr:MAG: hypothetical protein UY85_C0010G0010 [Candidatus Peribacteria bacterium GW2011_GWB1_54_5]
MKALAVLTVIFLRKTYLSNTMNSKEEKINMTVNVLEVFVYEEITVSESYEVILCILLFCSPVFSPVSQKTCFLQFLWLPERSTLASLSLF